jgi:hypothetical protein
MRADFTPQGLRAAGLVKAMLIDDLSKKGSIPLDDFDRQAYFKAFKPLMEFAARKGEGGDTAPQVWQVRFAIRNSEFRPSYEAVDGFVCRALGIVTGGEAATMRPVEALRQEYADAPAPHALIAGSPVDSARTRAKRLIAELANRAPGNSCKRAEDAVTYVWPGETSGDSPLSTIPVEDRERYCQIALLEIQAKGGGRHPRNVQRLAARLYLGAQAKRLSDAESGVMA